MLGLSYLTLALALATTSIKASPVEPKTVCKCLPGQPCFPSPSTISAFESTLSQPLIHPRPMGSVCFPNDPTFNALECDAVKSKWHNGAFRTSVPEAAQFINWETMINSTAVDQCDPFGDVNDTCFQGRVPWGVVNVTSIADIQKTCDPFGDVNDTCFQGRVPWGVVNVTSIADIQKTVKFASQHNLKLIVKNTGHENLGRSFGQKSIMLWTHNMQEIKFSNSFVPKNAPSGTQGVTAVTIEPGVQWGTLYRAVAEKGQLVVGGIGAGGSVGAGGGWPMGGGHSVLSPFYGLGVDNIVEETVVLPNGEHVTANLYTNPDLFWALRGGGGPSFGILTS
ncbi:hypothetical protein CVT24_013335, partial [Panaeolus cyanescens]